MRRYAGLLRQFILQRTKVQMEYRVDFFLGVLSSLSIMVGGLLALWVVMQHVPRINGWGFYEVVLIHGLLSLALAPSFFFAINVWYLGDQYIRTGAFDRFLVRPINPLFHLVVDAFWLEQIAVVFEAAAVVAYASVGLGLVWTPLKVLYTALAVLSGSVIFGATFLITATAAFWIIDSRLLAFATFKLFEFAKYPLTIYPRVIQAILTWVIPYGLISFYPASYILGRDVGGMAFAGVGMAVLLALVSYRWWLFGLRHYASTGS